MVCALGRVAGRRAGVSGVAAASGVTVVSGVGAVSVLTIGTICG